MKNKLVVFVVSDSIGETAEFVVRAAASQYNGNMEIFRYPLVDDVESVRKVVNEATNYQSIIVYTLVMPGLRKEISEYAKERGILAVDIMGPMLDAFSTALTVKPKLEPGLVRKMDEQYHRRVEAIEFAVKYDDGKDGRGFLLADVVLIGISRTSKTPLSMYLAHRGYKTANLPLVPEVDPPEELYAVKRSKIIGLRIDPYVLIKIRGERLKALGLKSQANYANMARILEELEYADSIIKKIGCRAFDVSDKAIEEVASKVMECIGEVNMYDW